MTLGETLRSLRIKQGWDQEMLAEKLGVSRQAVSKWELDKAVPEVKSIVAMSGLFGVTTDYLLKQEAPQEEPGGSAAAPPPAKNFTEIFSGRDTRLPVWHPGFSACRTVELGNAAAVMLLGLYLSWYFFGFTRPSRLFPALIAVALPILIVLGKLLLENADIPPRLLRRFRRDVGLATALWAFTLALFLGFGELLTDLLAARVSGAGGMLTGSLLIAGLLTGSYGLGWLLTKRLIPKS